MSPPATERPDGAEVLKRFETCIDRQLDLCRALESLADDLPALADTHAAGLLLEKLKVTLAQCHGFEETQVFPALTAAVPDIGATLERLRTEHLEDEDLAAELGDALESYRTARSARAADELGYMLRGLFTALRRHLAFDRERIAPLYRRGRGL